MDIDQLVELELKRLEEGNVFENSDLCREVYKNELARNIRYQQLQKWDREKVAMQFEIKNLQLQLANKNNTIKALHGTLEALNKTIRDLTETSVGDTCEIPEDVYVEVRDTTRSATQMHTERNAEYGRSSARTNEPPPKAPILERGRTITVSTSTDATDLPHEYPYAIITREQARSNTLPRMPSRALPHGPEPSLGNHHRRLQAQDDFNASTTPASTSDEDILASSFSSSAFSLDNIQDTTGPPTQMVNVRNSEYGRSSARAANSDHRSNRTVSKSTNTTDLPPPYHSAIIPREQAKSNTLPRMPSRALPNGPEQSLGDNHRRLQAQDDFNASTTPGSTSVEDILASSFSSSGFSLNNIQEEPAKPDKKKSRFWKRSGGFF